MIDGVGGGKKSGENFFLTWQKRKTWQKNVEKSSKKLVKNVLVKNITFLQRQQINQLDEMKNAVITVTIRSLKSG